MTKYGFLVFVAIITDLLALFLASREVFLEWGFLTMVLWIILYFVPHALLFAEAIEEFDDDDDDQNFGTPNAPETDV